MKFLIWLGLIVLANAADFSGRIHNGQPAFETDTFVFRLLSIENEETRWANVSSGAAISENVGLIVAQAVYGFQSWYVGYGSVHVNQQKLQIIPSNNIVIHSEYNPATLRNNIAVIRFTEALPNFLPIAPARPDFPILLTFGYGYNDAFGTNIPNTLQQLVVMDSTDGLCEDYYPDHEEGTSLCGLFPIISEYGDGDQGGAVVDAMRGRLYGLVSHWGAGGNDPLVSVSIPAHIEFIEQSIAYLHPAL